MHKKNTQHWSRLISIAGILAVLFGGLVAQSVRAVSSNPTPVCVGSSCTLTFDAAGDYFLWTPPIGAKNISFDLMGAQGGRLGGLGGRVTGSLTSVPTSLYVYVGGAGAQGSGVAGGFNGGGKAGLGRGDEGSGGGATDIRLTTATNTRLAVAAGGGGSGGYNGGVGGAGGGLTGGNGVTGDGQGGIGGSQTSGGYGGYPNGGTWGVSGSSAQGGSGGSSGVAGGGGGGGGYFGGGGGGADTDATGVNAGAGGGGSSWTNSTQTASVTNTSGYRSGAGLAIIKYVMPPSVTSFTTASTLIGSATVSYGLVFSESVTGLTNTDVSMQGSTTGCSTLEVSGSATTYTVTVSGCSSGVLKITLLANSVTGLISGPVVDNSPSEVTVDRTAPTVIITLPNSPTNLSILTYSLEFSETVTGLSGADFSIAGAGCEISTLTGTGTSYSLEISGCTDGATAQLGLAPASVTDGVGNAGPVEFPTIAPVQIIRTAPSVIWSAVPTTSYESPSFGFSFANAVTGITESDFLMIGAATGCSLAIIETVTGFSFAVQTTNCSDGTVQVLMNAGAYQDLIGNVGPAIVKASAVTTKIPMPAPIPDPEPTVEPTPQPTSPAMPDPTPEPTPSGNAVVAPEPVASPEPSSAPTVAPTPEPTVSPAPVTPVTPVNNQSPAQQTSPVLVPIVETPSPVVAAPAVETVAPVLESITAEPDAEPGAEQAAESTASVEIIEAGTVLIASQPANKNYNFSAVIEKFVEPLAQLFVDSKNDAPQITVQNPTSPKPLNSSPTSDLTWQAYVALGFGAVSITLTGIGLVRGARQLRMRRLVRKFA